jgi:hypothetical protein
MDQWLTWSYLEAGGGGTGQESYELGLYFLALHTEMDCWVKRRQRGYLFMTGDENPYPILSRHIVDSIIGDRLDDDLKVEEVVAELQKTFVPFFLIPDPDRAKRCGRHWRALLGDHVLVMDSPEDACFVAAGAVLIGEGLVSSIGHALEVLEQAGMEHDRAKCVARALAPLVDVAASPAPAATASASPEAAPPETPSALRRFLGLFKS